MSSEENKDIWDKLSHKKDIYKVPEGYFEDLPQIIQAKAVESAKVKQRNAFVYSLRYALPVVLVIIVALVTLLKPSEKGEIDVGGMLAEVSIEELEDFLDDTEISTNELLSELDITGLDFEVDIQETDLFEDDISEDELDNLLEDFSATEDFL